MIYKTSTNKKLTKFILSFSLFIIALLLLLFSFLRSSLPPMDGEVKLKNLNSKVQVLRDTYGIPHIEAKNNLDGFRALGFVIASERLFQMEMMRRMASGELSEIFGPKTLASDKLFRSLGLRAYMSDMIQTKMDKKLIDTKMWAEVEAFYDGVNQFQDLGKLPIEFTLLKIKPRPFSALDGYAFIGLMSFSFGVALNEDPLLTKLKKKFGDELIEDLRNETTPFEKNQKSKSKRVVWNSVKSTLNNSLNHSPTSLNSQNSDYPISTLITEVLNGFPLFEGSNGWLLSGSRSASGFPVLANDPHIAYSQPGVWFEAHLKTPNFETYGHFLPILPFPILSHNLERGWGFTMTLTDDMDLYREKLNPKFKSYQFKNQEIAYKERLEVIGVKGQKSEEILVIETQHGPLLDHVIKSDEDKNLALKWSFLKKENDPLFAIYKMNQAKNMEEFKAALSLGVAPGLNVLYADKKNIGWWMFGEVPIKSKHLASDYILDGSSGLDEYNGVLSFDKKPHLENPENGLIVSANSRPDAFPNEERGDWQPDDRYKTIRAVLDQKKVWSIDELKEVQTLSLNLENKLILEQLLKNVSFENLWKKERSINYLEILKKWDFISDSKSIAPSIYYTWTTEITKILLRELSQDEFEAFTKLPNSWNFFKKVILNADSPWWRKFDRKKTITDAFNNTIESLRQNLGEDHKDWAWGHLHTLEFVHPVGKIKPFDKLFNCGPYEMSGGSQEVNNQKSNGFKDGFKIKAGPSTRRLVDFAHPEVALGVLPTGNSGHILSPYYNDQSKLFTKGDYRYEWLNLKDIEAHLSHKLILNPLDQ